MKYNQGFNARTFKIGDKVRYLDEWREQFKLPDNTYEVQTIVDVPEIKLEMVGHTQWLILSNHANYVSGAIMEHVA